MTSPAPFIFGAPRSGTTLLRLMLDSHPELAIPPETGFISAFAKEQPTSNFSREKFVEMLVSFPLEAPAWSDYSVPRASLESALREFSALTLGDGFREFYRIYAARFGKSRWGDKTPMHAFFVRELSEILPEARFIHIIRDGRDVACSLRHLWFRPGDSMEALARSWVDHIQHARQSGRNGAPYLEVRFEELLEKPRAVLETVCSFIELEFHEQMMRYYELSPRRLDEHRTRYTDDGTVLVSGEQRRQIQQMVQLPPKLEKVAVWKSELSRAEVDEFENTAGPLLIDLGYGLSRPSWA